MWWRNLSTFRSLSARLALLHVALGVCSLAAVLAVSYGMLYGTLQRELDYELWAEVQEYRAVLEGQNLDVLRDVLEEEAKSEGVGKLFFRVLDRQGATLFSTEDRVWKNLEVKRGLLVGAGQGRIVFDQFVEHEAKYPARVVYGPLGNGLILQMAISTEDNVQILRQFRRIFLWAVLVFAGCSTLAGMIMARGALRGVQRVTQAARDIGAGAWNSRVPLSGRQDEIDELAGAFNEMIEWIQRLVAELRKVSDDIAHDLRTPVTRMRALAELALAQRGEGSPVDELAGEIVEECDHLLAMINTMLEISQTEAGACALDAKTVDLFSEVGTVADLFRAAAEDKHLHFHVEGTPGLRVHADPRLLKRALAHVTDNAVKYTPEHGTVAIICRECEGMAAVEVRDTGPGIAPENREKVFARFYRADPSRHQSGNGLGLSLARAIFRAHDGDLTVESSVGEGSVFRGFVPLQLRRKEIEK